MRRLCLSIVASATVLFSINSPAPATADVTAARLQLDSQCAAFPASGGTGSIAVEADSDTNWSLSVPTWVTIASGSPWDGSGIARFTVAANTSDAARAGTISVGSSNFTITQAGLSCVTTVSRSSEHFAATGASNRSINVRSSGECFWSAASLATWITIPGGGVGNGSGSVIFNVAPNLSNSPRASAIVVGSAVYLIDQDAAVAACNPLPSPFYYDHLARGGSGSFDLFVTGSCGGSWTAVSDSPWVKVKSGSGSGPGTVTYTVEANPKGEPREATIIANHQPHFVRQAASSTPGYVTLPCSQDTSFGSNFFPDGTPTDPTLFFGGLNAIFRDYFQFDLTGGLPAAKVSSAEAWFYVTSKPAGDPILNVARVTTQWTESSPKLSAVPGEQVIRHGVPTFVAGWNKVDVTDAYRQWMSGAWPNYGIRLAPQTAPANARGLIASRENGSASLRPMLVLAYAGDDAVERRTGLGRNQPVRTTGDTTGYFEIWLNLATGESAMTQVFSGPADVPLLGSLGQVTAALHYDLQLGRVNGLQVKELLQVGP